MCAFGYLEYWHIHPVLIWILKAHDREEIMHLARKNLCYSRVFDDLDIDLEAAKEKANILLKEVERKNSGRKATSRGEND